MPDADAETTVKIIVDSAFGCAGQRCLAASVVITVGDAAEKITLLADPAYRSGPQFGALIDVTTNVSATLQSVSFLHRSKLRILK